MKSPIPRVRQIPDGFDMRKVMPGSPFPCKFCGLYATCEHDAFDTDVFRSLRTNHLDGKCCCVGGLCSDYCPYAQWVAFGVVPQESIPGENSAASGPPDLKTFIEAEAMELVEKFFRDNEHQKETK